MERETDLTNKSGISGATVTIVAVALTIFFLSLGQGELTAPTWSNFYVDQAEAFLHGRLDIDVEYYDIAIYEGKSYLPFPPLPAVLLGPFVALFGGENTKVTIIALALTCINVIILLRIFKRLGIDRDSALWLTLAFFLGTGYWITVAHCNVWAYAHVVAVTFLLLALHETLGSGRGLVAGFLLGCAVLSRQMTIYASVFVLTALWLNNNHVSTRSRWRNALGFVLALCVLGAIYLTYNWARFGNPLETGYSRIDHAGHLKARFERFGLFHPAYVLFNFTYMFLQGPHFVFDGGLTPVGMDPFGTSLLFASPFVVFAVFARWRRPLLLAAWVSISLALFHMLFYYNNGWIQVNNQRFSLDFLPVLMLLVAVSVEHTNKRLLRTSIVYSVALNCLALYVLPVVLGETIKLIKGLTGWQ